jgi:quinol-cytochrome oxidoreductase complex cytochrome b subunit
MRIAVSRALGVERVVTPLVLFFDLVYVFAIGQLLHQLLEHVDLRTGAETVIMVLAVVYAWYMTAWGANWLNPDLLLQAGRAASSARTGRYGPAGLSEERRTTAAPALPFRTLN